MKTETLDEWRERHRRDKHSAVRVLEENLRANLDALTNLSASKKSELMRYNMIMVRQFAEDCGVK